MRRQGRPLYGQVVIQNEKDVWKRRACGIDEVSMGGLLVVWRGETCIRIGRGMVHS